VKEEALEGGTKKRETTVGSEEVLEALGEGMALVIIMADLVVQEVVVIVKADLVVLGGLEEVKGGLEIIVGNIIDLKEVLGRGVDKVVLKEMPRASSASLS